MNNDKLREALIAVHTVSSRIVAACPEYRYEMILVGRAVKELPAPDTVDDKALAEAIARLDAGDTSCLLTGSVEVLAAFRREHRKAKYLDSAYKKSERYNTEMDRVIDDEHVAVSCINPLEDLKRAVAKLKARATDADAKLEAAQQELKKSHSAIEALYKQAHESCEFSDSNEFSMDMEISAALGILQQEVEEARAFEVYVQKFGDYRKAFNARAAGEGKGAT